MSNLIQDLKETIIKSQEELSEKEHPHPKDIDVENIQPEEKDHSRAMGLEFTSYRPGEYKSTFKGSGEPWDHEAKKMAQSIKDPNKLVRRAKAVYARHGDPREPDNNTGYFRPGGQPKKGNVFHHFEKRMKELGFTSEQIKKLKESTKRK